MNTENEQEIRQLRTIAALYTKRSKLREAEAVYKSLLSIQEKHNGEFSPELALTCYQLAEVYADLGQYICARPLYERAVTIWESLGKLKLVKPEETIFFMDAMVALQTNNEIQHEEHQEQAKNQASADSPGSAKKSAA
jgi:tetratricopeptide (TPR) repeat protein